jgi:hypothetical protein
MRAYAGVCSVHTFSVGGPAACGNTRPALDHPPDQTRKATRMNPSHRMTWIDSENTAWRIELITGRWQLSRYSPDTEQWQRVGSFPTRDGAIQASYEKNSGAS